MFKYDLRLQKRPVRRYKYIIYKFIWSSRNGGHTTIYGYRGVAMRKRFPSTIYIRISSISDYYASELLQSSGPPVTHGCFGSLKTVGKKREKLGLLSAEEKMYRHTEETRARANHMYGAEEVTGPLSFAR